MELHQLRYLVLLAEELNFTRAARRGNVAQPALSRQIRKLEDELGVPLVDRTTRRVRLTAAGVRFVERARHVLAELEAAKADAQSAVALLSGSVTIGMTQTPGPLDAATALAAFHRRHPDVDLALREDLSVTLADRLRDDVLDLAFVSSIDARARRGLELSPLASEPLLLVVARDHRLAGRAEVRPRELAGERFVAFPEGATIRAAVARSATRAGFEPRVAFESNEIARTLALVAEGLGVAVLPRSDALRPGPAAVTALPIRDRTLVHEVLLAWRSGRRLNPAAAELRRLLVAGEAAATARR
jgi:LysR family transcriptional activator of glutamate synthase operon